MELGTFIVVLLGVAGLWSTAHAVDDVAAELARIRKLMEEAGV